MDNWHRFVLSRDQIKVGMHHAVMNAFSGGYNLADKPEGMALFVGYGCREFYLSPLAVSVLPEFVQRWDAEPTPPPNPRGVELVAGDDSSNLLGPITEAL